MREAKGDIRCFSVKLGYLADALQFDLDYKDYRIRAH